MTTIYFVRHAEPNYEIIDDRTRPLSEQGLIASERLAGYFENIDIDEVMSSPYKRAYDTVLPIALSKSLEITEVEGFRERAITEGWIEDFTSYCKKQWYDFNYKLPDGECLREVQERNIIALNSVCSEFEDNSIIVGSHGIALSTILNHFDSDYGLAEFNRIKAVMPFIVKLEFQGLDFVGYEFILEF